MFIRFVPSPIRRSTLLQALSLEVLCSFHCPLFEKAVVISSQEDVGCTGGLLNNPIILPPSAPMVRRTCVCSYLVCLRLNPVLTLCSLINGIGVYSAQMHIRSSVITVSIAIVGPKRRINQYTHTHTKVSKHTKCVCTLHIFHIPYLSHGDKVIQLFNL